MSKSRLKYQKSAPLTLNAAAELDLMIDTGDGDDDEELLILGTEEDELESQAA